MLYHLAMQLLPHFSALNLFTYHTVRAGGAAFTGFVICLIAGPWLIRRLRALKIGQVIKKDHVDDLHALHKGKSGTPTMGGALLIFSAVAAVLLWSTLTNRLLWAALIVLVILGVVGFIDDYIKLKRKHNDGLSARAKFAGQILAGALLGLYLVFNPITVSPAWLQVRDIVHWQGLVQSLHQGAQNGDPAVARIWARLNPRDQGLVTELAEAPYYTASDRLELMQALNAALANRDLYDPAAWPDAENNGEIAEMLALGLDTLSGTEAARFNRLLLEKTFPELIAQSQPDLHTKVGVPGFKDLLIPLGVFYAVFVILIVVSVSNAVNLTDGLDGLAAGASIVSILAYTGIAYVVSRSDWSSYLYLIYIPEASELFVFGAALLGAGMGFLWFNAHPAEVFMGDTGSLALGGAIAAMAVLTKHELLLFLVAGIFVVEAASVVLQVGSYKLTGKRIFRMAPLHHHFELMGWPETKVVMRFWIMALIFALMSLATLKLR